MKFPLKPKPGQLDFAYELLDYFYSPDGALVIEAYSGVGKTIASLWALRCAGRKGIVGVRTYEEAGNFYFEAKRLGVKLAVLLSKKSFCTNPSVAPLPPDLFYQACLSAASAGVCGSPKLEKPVDAPDFHSYVEELRKGEGCPFVKTLKFAVSSDAVVVTYPYVFKHTSKLQDLFNRFNTIIYDEAHNLVHETLEASAIYPSELKKLAQLYSSNLLRVLVKHTSGKKQPRKLVEDAAWELAEILGCSVLVRRDCVLVYREPSPLLKEASVFMSGFIPDSISDLISSFVGKVKRREVGAPDSIKVKTAVVEDIDSKYENREENAPLYRKLVEAFSQLPGRKAVFYASKKLMRMVGLPENAIKPTRVFRPPSSEDYLIADVLGGRLSEGSNVPFDAVLIVGFPYPEIDPALRFVLNSIREKYGDEFAWKIYEDTAFCKVVQAIGRLTRTKGHCILADSRGLKYRYPSWVAVEKTSYSAVLDALERVQKNTFLRVQS